VDLFCTRMRHLNKLVKTNLLVKTDSLSLICRAVKMIAKMVQQLKGRLKLQSKRKVSSIVEDAKGAMQAEMLKVQKKIKKDR
jgi:hypothetical protein